MIDSIGQIKRTIIKHIVNVDFDLQKMRQDNELDGFEILLTFWY